MEAIVSRNSNILSGDVLLPSSKSFVHRYAIICSFLNKDVTINDVTFSDDINATLSCLSLINNNVEVGDTYIKINPSSYKLNTNNVEVFASSSASTLRILAGCLSLGDFKNVSINGTSQLQSRNFENLLDFNKDYDLSFPINICKFDGDILHMDASLSSQYVSGAIIGMCLFNKKMKINAYNLSSKQYVDLTIEVLASLGFDVVEIDGEYSLKSYEDNKVAGFDMEGDLTHAINFLTIGKFNDVNILNLNINSSQAEKHVLKYFEDVNNIESVVDCTLFPDSVAILCLYFSQVCDQVTLTNIQRLKFKESDRILSTITTLKKFNVDIEYINETIVVKKSELKLLDCNFDSFDDHRVVFLICSALALLKQVSTITINDISCINKSFPSYCEQMSRLGLDFNFKE